MITIYIITNRNNLKYYIGQTKNSINIRFNQHITDSKRNNTRLSNAIKKYGVGNFFISSLSIGDYSKEQADFLETYYISLLNTKNRDIGYNIKNGGNSVEMSIETKNKISKANKGMKMPKRLFYSDNERYNEEKLKKVRENRRNAKLGAKNTKAKQIKIDNILFETLKDASNYCGVNWKTLSRHLKKTKNNEITIRVAKDTTKTFTLT
jgi:group I intron endonuclease